jgi:hypothetical protein
MYSTFNKGHMKMDFDEKAFEQRIKDQRFVIAEPAVKGLKAPYESEVMFAGGQWTLGKTFDTNKEAKEYSENACASINAMMREGATAIVSELKLKPAKP